MYPYLNLLILLFCILFYPYVPVQAGQERAAIFAASGLLARTNESAEEILLRAHQNDRNAIVLAVLGYYQGLGDFPKSLHLASGWVSQLAKVNDPDALCILTLMLWEKSEVPDMDLGGLSAMCPYALKSPLADFLQQSGISDTWRFCEELEKNRSATPEQGHRHAESTEALQIIAQDQSTIIKATRDFRDKPCSPNLAEDFYTAQQKVLPEFIVFYAATTHNTATETPDWSVNRLMLFLDKLNACQHLSAKGSAAAVDADQEWRGYLADRASLDIFTSLSFNKEAALSTIRSAHALVNKESLRAMLDMALHYRLGSLGFVQNDTLSALWLQQAAFACEDEGRLLLALNFFAEKRYAEAWAWATIIGKSEDAPEEIKKSAAQLLAMIETQEGKGIQEKGRQFESSYFQATLDLIDWLDSKDADHDSKKRPF